MIKLVNILNEIQVQGSVTPNMVIELFYKKMDELRYLNPHVNYWNQQIFPSFNAMIKLYYGKPHKRITNYNLGGSHPFDEKGSPSSIHFEKIINKFTQSELNNLYNMLLKFKIK